MGKTRTVAALTVCLAISLATALAAPIHDAAATGDLESVKKLVKADKSCLNAIDERGRTPLHRACHEGRIEVVKFLIDKGAPVGQRDTAYQLTPLHFAAWNGQVKVAQYLLSKGADLNAREKDNETALYYAAATGKLPMIELLVSRGSDVNDTLSRVGNTVVSLALDRRQPEAVKRLINLGASTRLHPRGEYPAGWTLMHTAAWEYGPDLIDYLAGHDVPVDQKTTDDRTPLHNACMQGNFEGAKALVALEADVNARMDNGAVPLFFAVSHGNFPMTSFLMESGAKAVGGNSVNGMTLLHYASIRGYGDIAGLLIDRGVDIKTKDSKGRTALDCALQYGQTTCASLLKARVATSSKKKAVKPDTPKNGQAIVYYLGHSGWVVRTANHLLVFDYFKGDRLPDNPGLANGCISPSEMKGTKVIVFASHVHGDHYVPAIFDWRKDVPDLTYVMGFAPQGKEGFVQLANRETREVAGAEVTAIPSTDSGQGFLVTVDGVTILHPGDHANRNRDLSGAYVPEIDFLASKAGSVDIMFVPVTGCNFGDVVAVRTGDYYAIRKLKPKAVFPMHGGEGGPQYAEFADLAKKEGIDVPIYAAEFSGDNWQFKFE